MLVDIFVYHAILNVYHAQVQVQLIVLAVKKMVRIYIYLIISRIIGRFKLSRRTSICKFLNSKISIFLNKDSINYLSLHVKILHERTLYNNDSKIDNQ